MTSSRRLKLLVVTTFVVLVVVLFYSADTHRARRQELQDINEARASRQRANKLRDSDSGQAPMGPSRPGGDGTTGVDHDEESSKMQQKLLKDAEAAAKKKANEKAPRPPPEAEKLIKADDKDEKAGKEEVPKEEQEVLDEIDDILKRSPIIIFSKSYCPFSMRAKKLLMEDYTIVPPPHVVELDQHKKGSAIQDALLKRTGRRTVPNVLVLGTSIGGSDDVAALERDGQLKKRIKDIGKNRIMEMTKKS